MILNSNN